MCWILLVPLPFSIVSYLSSRLFVRTWHRICSELVPFFPNRHLHQQKFYPTTHPFLFVSSDPFRWPFWPSFPYLIFCKYLILFQSRFFYRLYISIINNFNTINNAKMLLILLWVCCFISLLLAVVRSLLY